MRRGCVVSFYLNLTIFEQFCQFSFDFEIFLQETARLVNFNVALSKSVLVKVVLLKIRT